MSRISLYFGSLFLVLGVFACSPQRLVDKGQLDKAFERAAKQLERNPKKDLKTATALAEAYFGLQERDYSRVQRIYAGTRPATWEDAVALLEDLEGRQSRIDAILRSVKRIPTDLPYDEPDYSGELVASREKAAAHLFSAAEELMLLARNGDRLSAREAYANLLKRDRYAQASSTVLRLRDEARAIGTVSVGLTATGDLYTDELNALGYELERRLAREWVHVLPQGQDVDLLVTIDALQPWISGVDKSSNTERFERIVKVPKVIGKDSTGADLVTFETKTYRAEVTTVLLERRSEASAIIEVRRGETGELLKSQEFRGRYAFEDRGTAVSGDREALEGERIADLDRSLPRRPGRVQMSDAALEALSQALPRWNLDALALGPYFAGN